MSMIPAAAFALALVAQDPQAAPSTPDPEAATRLADVIVSHRELDARAESFVAEVAAPPNRRGLARWASPVCVGAVNIRTAVAQPLIDRVSRLALDLNLRIGGPGCTPNVVVIFSDDASALAKEMVARDRAAFHWGVGGLDRGKSALQAFQDSDAAVRWWHVSIPVVGATGDRAVRFPGDIDPIYVPGEGLVNRGRPLTDILNKVFIVLDVNKLDGVNLAQLSDYVALLAMAQIDPDGETAAYDTVLNLFDDPQGVSGLSDWDAVYLQALYDAMWERVNPGGQADAIARLVRRAEREQVQREPAAQ